MSYSDNRKREYMRMFFNDMPSDVARKYLDVIPLKDNDRKLLKYRYVDGKCDKLIARYYELSPLWINKQINIALVKAYESLKTLQINDLLKVN